VPEVLEDIASHDCLRLSNAPQGEVHGWGENHHAVCRCARFSCSNVEGVRELCVEGIGIAQLTWLDVK